MRRAWLVIILFLCAAFTLPAWAGCIVSTNEFIATSFNGPLKPYIPSAPAGFIDKAGKVVIEPKFIMALDFSEGLAAVSRGADCAFIDKQGAVKISDPKFEEVGSFHDGLAKAKAGDKWGFIDKSGKWIVEPRYDAAGDFYEGMARVAEAVPGTGGKKREPKMNWGYVDASGKVVVPPTLYEARDFSEGLAAVRRTGGEIRIESDYNGIKMYKLEEVIGFIDKTGAMAIPPQYKDAMQFNEGLACVKLLDGKPAYIDKTGKIAIRIGGWPADPFGGLSSASANFREGVAFADTSKGFVHVPKWGFIDKTGTTVATLDANTASLFSEGLVAVGKGKLHFSYGYADKTGKIVIPFQYKQAQDFSEGLAAVRTDKAWGYIDATGKQVIAQQFDSAQPFREGLARVIPVK